MKILPKFSSLTASASLGAMLLTGCGQASEDTPGTPSSSSRGGNSFPVAAAYLPDASLAVSIDMASILASNFYQKVDAAGAESGLNYESMLAEMDPEARAAFEALDIKPENITSIVFSMGGLDFTYGDPMSNPESLRFSGVMTLDKKVTADQIRSIIAEHVDESHRDDITEISHRDVTFFTGPEEPGEPRVAFGVHEGSRASTIIFGDLASAQATADRAAGSPTVPAHISGLVSEMVGQSNFWMIFSMPDELRAMLEEQIAQNPMAQMMAPLLGLNGVALSTNSAEDLEIALSGLFAEAEQAGTVAMMINAQFLPMAKMMMTDQEGQLPPFLQKLTSSAEGNIFKLATTITAEEAIEMGNDLPMPMGGF